jgi:hypothetical protein
MTLDSHVSPAVMGLSKPAEAACVMICAAYVVAQGAKMRSAPALMAFWM